MSTPDPAEWSDLAPHPGDHNLPAGRHELHRSRLLAAIAQETRTRKPARAPLRPALAAAALVLVVVGVGAGLATTSGDEPSAALPSPAASSPTALPSPDASSPAARSAPPDAVGKIRAYGTVRQLTDTADLVVRGEVVSVADGRAVYRVAEVLYRAPDAPLSTEITLLAESAGRPGQPTVLYLALSDPEVRGYAPLSGDFGIFDVAGDRATSRSPIRSVTGLRTEDATLAGRAFVTTLPELRQVARERG
ncbi:hypothetical protein [Micromonospora parathelypteridis]|uniref:Uncharacterized protein n=1 Tax=Micromonospora parathelypteridis TaxID=1839617 RepID=A0A840VPF5_9ACTN|nr:hypothetical protein [Micromonospora parathelypteridis]MBB5475924.1 hypothetical protein [Micromonospora parathelypteridis]GGO32042.1 hypothetical protein GCM10011576_61810 [Micromonospora parathelypteridis]